jgi:hypothetical protein
MVDNMSAFKIMALFYGALMLVPIMLWIIAVTSPDPQFSGLRFVLALLVGIGSIVFGVIGFKEVFVHG